MKFRPLLAALFAFATLPGWGMFIRPEEVPIKKLIDSVEAVIAKEPKNAEAYYTLGRIHYLAFVTSFSNLQAYPANERNKLPSVDPFKTATGDDIPKQPVEAERRALAEMKLEKAPQEGSPLYKEFLERKRVIEAALYTNGWKSTGLPDEEGAPHIAKAVESLRMAMTLSPKKSLYQLGYASLFEQTVRWGKEHPAAKIAPEFRSANRSAMLREYQKAWSMELEADLKDKDDRGMFSPADMVSFEAGMAYERIAEEKEAELSADEKVTLAKVRESLGELMKGHSHAVTPLILSPRAVSGIGELLAPEKVVTFPLRGWGPDGRWSWVQPGTALLVWNPSGSGKVASGAQLFGGYTWELFWKNGYEPLAVLDADGDGTLRGEELAGIAVWCDANGDGVSDPGEVVPLAQYGITALATHPTGTEGEHPMNAQGVTFRDGRVLPTWDWMAAPAAAVAPRP